MSSSELDAQKLMRKRLLISWRRKNTEAPNKTKVVIVVSIKISTNSLELFSKRLERYKRKTENRNCHTRNMEKIIMIFLSLMRVEKNCSTLGKARVSRALITDAKEKAQTSTAVS
jgi:hypothetical protein